MGKFEDDLAMQDNDDEMHVVPRRTRYYIILPTSAAIGRLISDLGLPHSSDEIFCSMYISGADFVGVRIKGAKHKYLQTFTVELFGVQVDYRPIGEMPQVPNPPEDAWPPEYWVVDDHKFHRTIQIWRTRVFRAAPPYFTPPPRGAVTPYRPSFPYLEKRWHPQEEMLSVSLGGLDGVFSGFSVLKQFYDDAYDILKRKHTNAGRPRVFADTEQFIRKVQVAYVEIWHKRKHVPLQKEVAERLGCKHNTFKDYWCKEGNRPWHQLFDLLINNHR